MRRPSAPACLAYGRRLSCQREAARADVVTNPAGSGNVPTSRSLAVSLSVSAVHLAQILRLQYCRSRRSMASFRAAGVECRTIRILRERLCTESSIRESHAMRENRRSRGIQRRKPGTLPPTNRTSRATKRGIEP